MRLVFFGSGAFGLPTLQHLARLHDIVGVVTQPDRPAGRGGRLTPTPIGAWAAQNLPGVPVLKPGRVNEPDTVEGIRGLNADAWVVIAFGQKLSRELLDGVCAVNLHASLLPRWRGAAPINAAILAGDSVTGNTIITLADRMDAGLILATSERPITPTITAGELHDLLSNDGPALVDRVLKAHAAGTLEPRTQRESDVTIATKLSRDLDDIDFHQPADFLRRQIHAFTPWPGITAALATSPPITLKLLRAATAPAHASPAEPGTLIDARAGLVACGGKSTLQLLEVQPPGKRPMPWSSFANGRDIPRLTQVTSARSDTAEQESRG